MKVTCPNCGKPGYLLMQETDREWNETTMTAKVLYIIEVKHGSDSFCELAPVTEKKPE